MAATHVAVADHEAFSCEFLPQRGAEDEGATRIHGLTREHLRQNGIPLADGLRQLKAWTDAVRGASGAKLVFVGHDAPFDWSFVHHSYHAAGASSPFGWKALDTNALAMGVLGLPWF